LALDKKEDTPVDRVYVDGFRITLKHVHPNAYSLKELFGDGERNGIANCLIKEGYEELEKHVHHLQQRNPLKSSSDASLPFNHVGIVFDSEISSWIEPLLPLIKSSSNYVQPNGKNVIVEHPLKLIF
jgi:hypothetical protein